MTKYQIVFQEMLNQNQSLFDNFRKVHDQYAEDPKKWQEEFNEVGREAQDIVRRYENKLCGHSENSGFGKYSTQLSEKFQAQVRSVFPKIDFVGAKVRE